MRGMASAMRTAGEYRIAVIRMMLVLIGLIGALRPVPAAAMTLDVGTSLCHAVTSAARPNAALATLRFTCRGAPASYQHGSLWLRADLGRLAIDRNDVVLMVHQSRFDSLTVAFSYADGKVEWQHVASGAFGAHWRVGGQIAFEAPVHDAPLAAVTMRFDRVASHHLLRMRLVSRAEAGAQTAMLAALVGAALMLLVLGAVYNLSLAIAVRRQFLAWHGGWAACVLVWGIIWSQIELLAFPGLAGSGSAQACTFLACIAITAATTSAATSLDRTLLPRWAPIITLALGLAIGLAGIPASLVRGASIEWIGTLLGWLVLADLAAVAACLGWAWRRGSADARDVALAWSMPMAALALTELFDIGGMLWGGGAQLLVLFAAALQTLWLSVATTRRLARLRVERDRARLAEAQASELAGRDPLTGLRNRRGFIERVAPLLGDRAAGVPIALLLIDLDRFKSINDDHGHEAGDIVLCTIARRLERWESASCAVARLGGEEFALLIAGIDGFALTRFADGVRQGLAACDHGPVIGDREVTASIGVVEARSPCDFQRLYRRADRALYAAKQNGRDRVIFSGAERGAKSVSAVDRNAAYSPR